MENGKEQPEGPGPVTEHPEGAGPVAEGGAGGQQEVQPTPTWYERLGFRSEEAAEESFRHARTKIKELGTEVKRLRSAPVAEQPARRPSAEEFFGDPVPILDAAAEKAARRVADEMYQRQQLEQKLTTTAQRAGVEREELFDAWQELQGADPDEVLRFVADVTKLRRGESAAPRIRAEVERQMLNKSRTPQASGGAHIPENTGGPPDFSKMEYPAIVAWLKDHPEMSV